MIFEQTPLSGAWLVTPELTLDARGAFGRLFCAERFAARGLEPRLEQVSLSFNHRAGVLRGLHLQRPPHAEAKLVRVTAGAIFDVIVDLRAGSPTYGRWFGARLDADARRQLYIPAGFAHGFQTLTDGAEVLYLISTGYAPQTQDGVRWNDPALAVAWPDPAGAVVSDRDRALPPLADFVPVEV
jgi:dTDP-4-dehydrorhamnose 3,5-epimerase